MKKIFYFIIISFFSFTTVSADSFNQLILEGMKIGENFTKHVDEPTIKATNMENFKNNKYSVSGFDTQGISENFDQLTISYKTSDKDYKILDISGTKVTTDINDCISRRDNLLNAYGTLLNKVKINGPETNNHPADSSGKSKITDVLYVFGDGFLHASCIDWSEEIGYIDHLNFQISEKKFMRWKQKNIKINN